MSNDVVVMFEGTIYEHGYGWVAQKVMRDVSLSIQAKAIYSYICSMAGNPTDIDNRKAFPSITLMKHELGIKSQDTFYKHMNQLKDKGYLKVEQEKDEKGKFKRNIYKIVAVPQTVEKEEHKPQSNFSTTDKPQSNFSTTDNPTSDNWNTNSNSFSSNSFNSFIEEEEEKIFTLIKKVNNISQNTIVIKERLKYWLNILPYEVIDKEIEYCLLSGARSWLYIEKALTEDMKLGIDTIDKLIKKQEDHDRKKNDKKNKKNKPRNNTRSTRIEKIPEWFDENEFKIPLSSDSELTEEEINAYKEQFEKKYKNAK